jgi:hypothetical protein
LTSITTIFFINTKPYWDILLYVLTINYSRHSDDSFHDLWLEKFENISNISSVSGPSITYFNIVCDIPVATLRSFPYVWFNFRITCCRFNAMLSDIGNYYNMCHHSLCKNKALYGVIIICINHKLWSPFWWFNSWTITTESKYMSVSGSSTGKFNIVCNISVETLRSFTYFCFNFRKHVS